MPADPQVAIGGKTVLFFVLKEPLNGFSDFGVRGRLSILIIHKHFARHERLFGLVKYVGVKHFML